MLKKESEGKKLRNSQVVDKLPENCVTKLWWLMKKKTSRMWLQTLDSQEKIPPKDKPHSHEDKDLALIPACKRSP